MKCPCTVLNKTQGSKECKCNACGKIWIFEYRKPSALEENEE